MEIQNGEWKRGKKKKQSCIYQIPKKKGKKKKKTSKMVKRGKEDKEKLEKKQGKLKKEARIWKIL